MNFFSPINRPDQREAFNSGSAAFEQAEIGGQSFTIIPDPSPEVKARIILAIAAGGREIVNDPEIPEFVTRVLLGAAPCKRPQDPGFWFKRDFDSFVRAVSLILECACSLRENDPQANIFERLHHNICQLDYGPGNNLSISISSVLIVESMLDKHCSRWREDREKPIFAYFPSHYRGEVEETLKNSCCRRDSDIAIHAKKLVGKILRHLLSSADAQELLGEPGDLQMMRPTITAPIKQAARISSRSDM